MLKSKRFVALLLLIPILLLAAQVVQQEYRLRHGVEVVLPITGYDPRDFLSGHYVTYTVQYGVDDLCPSMAGKRRAYVCLEPKRFSYNKPGKDCKQYIAGVCPYSRHFVAGIERFYIPEAEAERLDRLVRGDKASLRLIVDSHGKATIKDLLINGRPWQVKQ